MTRVGAGRTKVGISFGIYRDAVRSSRCHFAKTSDLPWLSVHFAPGGLLGRAHLVGLLAETLPASAIAKPIRVWIRSLSPRLLLAAIRTEKFGVKKQSD
jgi:hypothetical protein